MAETKDESDTQETTISSTEDKPNANIANNELKPYQPPLEMTQEIQLSEPKPESEHLLPNEIDKTDDHLSVVDTALCDSNIDKKGQTKEQLHAYTTKKVAVVDIKSKHFGDMLLGRRKSGRFWKGERDRFRSVIKTKGLKQKACAKKRIAQKEQLLKVKHLEVQMKEEMKQKRQEHKLRQEENKKRKMENEKKSEIVQVIKNPAKIKRMKKKQLRLLSKRDSTIVQR